MLFSRSFIESEIWSVLVFWIHRISNLGKRSACVGRRRCTDYPSDWCSLRMLHVKFKGGVVVSVGGVCKTVEGFPLLKRAISYSWELDGKLKQMSSNRDYREQNHRLPQMNAITGWCVIWKIRLADLVTRVWQIGRISWVAGGILCFSFGDLIKSSSPKRVFFSFHS